MFFLVSECFLCWLVYNWKSPKSDFLKKWALSPEGWSVFIFSYWTQRKLVPADNHVWNFSHQCSIFGCISNQWAVILSPRCSTKLTVSQQRHLVSFVRIPSKISWTHVGSVLQFCCDPPFVVPAEEMLLLLLTLLVLLCLSFSFSFSFCLLKTRHEHGHMKTVHLRTKQTLKVLQVTTSLTSFKSLSQRWTGMAKSSESSASHQCGLGLIPTHCRDCD